MSGVLCHSRANLFGMGWRICYFVAGIPGLLLGVLLMLEKDVRRLREEEGKTRVEMAALERREEAESLAKAEDETRDTEQGEDQGRCANAGAIATALFCDPVMILLFVAAAFRHSGLNDETGQSLASHAHNQLRHLFVANNNSRLHLCLQRPPVLPDLPPVVPRRRRVAGLRLHRRRRRRRLLRRRRLRLAAAADRPEPGVDVAPTRRPREAVGALRVHGGGGATRAGGHRSGPALRVRLPNPLLLPR